MAANGTNFRKSVNDPHQAPQQADSAAGGDHCAGRRRMTDELRKHEFGDPLRIIELREARSCKGCVHSKVLLDRQYCYKGKKHGKRCSLYKESE
jgi:hypothetical protein